MFSLCASVLLLRADAAHALVDAEDARFLGRVRVAERLHAQRAVLWRAAAAAIFWTAASVTVS